MITICKGIPGSQPHKVADPDDLIAGICESCEKALTGTKSWGSASPAQAKSNQSGVGIVFSDKHQEPKPRVRGSKSKRKVNSGNFTLPGGPSFETPKPSQAQSAVFRNYPKRKQPWNWEKP